MPKVLITGNGFDLNFYLPTTYKDFINILSALEGLKQHDFYSVYSNLSDYNNFWNYYETRVRFDEQKIKELINLTNENLWFKFFKNELEIETWIDFENKIEYVLKCIFSSLKLLQKTIFNVNQKDILIYNFPFLNNNIERFEILNFFKIITIQDKTNYMWTLNSEFLIKKYNYYIDIDFNKISTFLENELNKFKELFDLYFSTFVLPLYRNYKQSVNTNYFNNINYHFTFNYTPTFEEFYSNKIKSNYLHGRIGQERNNLVLGINDTPDNFENKIYFLPFTKYYQKLNNNTDYYFLNEIDNSGSANYMFFFFGHSLDKSDKDYIKEVFDFMKAKKTNKNKIVIVYHNEESKSKMLLNLLDILGKEDIVERMRNKNLLLLEVNSKELKDELNLDIYASGTIR